MMQLRFYSQHKSIIAIVFEIEYRLSGLCMTLFKKGDALNHLIKGMKINYGQHIIIKELFPLVFLNPDVQKLLLNYKKATE